MKAVLKKMINPMVELLAPAGQPAALQAALNSGADAVYLGGSLFSARARAANFQNSELSEAIDMAHLHGARVHLALNTLIADSEGERALGLAWQAARAGIDALIVQDIGLAARLRQILPELPLHASTQMTIADPASMQAIAGLGLSRVILPRELSLPEIKRMTALAASHGLETEVFIHGALCCSYSGQCFLSQLQGGRSGNRGDCAQPCRLAYQLGECAAQHSKDNADHKRFPWLSPRDQALWMHLPELISCGVRSLKIEGRMRDPAYVGMVTAIYRDLIDGQINLADPEVTRQTGHRLLLAFNRGGVLTDRHLTDDRRQSLHAGPISGSHGVPLGSVRQSQDQLGRLLIELDRQFPADMLPQRGDVLVIRRAGQEAALASAPIGSLERQGSLLRMSGFHPRILRQFTAGDRVYQAGSQQLPVLRPQVGKTRLALQIARPDSSGPITLTASVHSGLLAGQTVSISCPAEERPPLAAPRVQKQLAKTGSTPFYVDQISIAEKDSDGSAIPLAVASLNQLRRDLLQQLSAAVIKAGRRPHLAEQPPSWPLNQSRSAKLQSAAAISEPAGLKLSAYFYRLPEQPADLPCQADRYVLPLLALTAVNASAYIEAVHKAEGPGRCWVWLPAAARGIQAEILPRLLEQAAAWGVDGFYAGRPGLSLQPPFPLARAHDWGAHIYNANSLNWFYGQGIRHITPSSELAPEQAGLLAQTAEQDCSLEWPVYGRLRAMSIAICPIGEQHPDCRRCHLKQTTADLPDQSRLFCLEAEAKAGLPLLPHPRGCSAELFSRQLFSADRPSLDQLHSQSQQTARTYGRLSFLEETAAERRQLIASLRRQALDINRSEPQIARPGGPGSDFSGLAEAIARRLNSPSEQRRIF